MHHVKRIVIGFALWEAQKHSFSVSVDLRAFVGTVYSMIVLTVLTGAIISQYGGDFLMTPRHWQSATFYSNSIHNHKIPMYSGKFSIKLFINFKWGNLYVNTSVRSHIMQISICQWIINRGKMDNFIGYRFHSLSSINTHAVVYADCVGWEECGRMSSTHTKSN